LGLRPTGYICFYEVAEVLKKAKDAGLKAALQESEVTETMLLNAERCSIRD
jgi:hypothetical protein